MPYDPNSRGNRTYLALAIKAMLADSGFTKVSPKVMREEIEHSKKKKAEYKREKGFNRFRGRNRSNFEGIVREDTYERQTPHPNVRIRVYTTIVGTEVRGDGQDAIRVCLIYKDGVRTQGLIKQRRVNRTGVIKDIVNRTRGRMRDAWEAGKKLEKCQCGAPKFKSKKDNMVCADFCWTKKEKR